MKIISPKSILFWEVIDSYIVRDLFSNTHVNGNGNGVLKLLLILGWFATYFKSFMIFYWKAACIM